MRLFGEKRELHGKEDSGFPVFFTGRGILRHGRYVMN